MVIKLYERVKLMKPEPGYEDCYDVGIHSDGYTFANGHVWHDGEISPEIDVPLETLVETILNDPDYPGGPIRLVACCSGKYENDAAQQLADAIGRPILAPDKDIYVDFDGKYRLADNDAVNRTIINGWAKETGRWHLFEPR